MSKLRYGVVGAGRVFQRFHLPCLAARAELELVAACDVDPVAARKIVGDTAMVTDDLAEFLSAGLDVVAVCTPNDAHVDPVLGALAAGAAVLCEKPLAAELSDARRIADAAAPRPGVETPLIGVNLPYRFHELLPAFVAALPDGPCEIELNYRTAGLRLWRPVTGWYTDAARSGGGALLDLGPHALDLLTAVFGWPEVTSARVDRPGIDEWAEVDLRLDRGAALLRVDRASRTLGVDLTARFGADNYTLDLRRGQVTGPCGVLATASGQRAETAAIAAFLEAAVGVGGGVVSVAEALRLQELIAGAYAVAEPA